jgi:AcrR family transcriptional regulator
VSEAAVGRATPQGDRRARRRQETIDEILEIAEQVMIEEGVNGLSLSEVARRLGVQPPSLYRYFDSLMDLYDVLFQRGQRAHLEVLQHAADGAEPGLATVHRLAEASTRWCVANSALAQLLFYRPVPGFEPSPEAMAPSEEMFRLQREALADAVAAGQLGRGADSDDAVRLVSILVSGTVGQTIANEPGVTWAKGRFTRLLPQLIDAIVTVYPPVPGRANRR